MSWIVEAEYPARPGQWRELARPLAPGRFGSMTDTPTFGAARLLVFWCMPDNSRSVLTRAQPGVMIAEAGELRAIGDAPPAETLASLSGGEEHMETIHRGIVTIRVRFRHVANPAGKG